MDLAALRAIVARIALGRVGRGADFQPVLSTCSPGCQDRGMPRKHSSASVARQHVELAWAAPQVIAHRTARMLAAGATPNARDSAEFTRMFAEKTTAFSEAWVASWAAMAWAPYKVAMEVLRAGPVFARGGTMNLEPLSRAWRSQGWGIAGSGITPLHRAAVANARRLSRHRA